MDLSSLKVLFCGSEPIRENTFKKFSDKFSVLNFKSEMFLPCYGLAEATLMVSGISQLEEPKFYHADMNSLERGNIVREAINNQKSISYSSCGRTWNNTDVIIVDPDTNQELSELHIGEIWVKNDSVCSGYWNKPKETKMAFDAFTADNNKGPYLKTGDLGFSKNQDIYVTGRIKELIILRGRNFFPTDIENIIDKCHPALQPNGCAVFTIEENNTENLVIVQEIKRVHIKDFNKDEVFNSIIKAVSDNFEISIHSIIIISPMSLPKTTSGKIKRLDCKNIYLENNLKIISSIEKCEPQINKTVIESNKLGTEDITNWIKNWLSNKLAISIEQIDSSQPILSYGLDSIGAVELESDINETFDLDIFLGDFLENNTINYLAETGIQNRI